MALTDTAIKNAKAKPKPYKLGDAQGLFLLVQPSGGKLWRLKYRVNGKEKKLALGTYPEVTLAEARKRRDKAREQLAEGKDPGREKAREKAQRHIEAGNTFELVAREYFAKRKRDGDRPWATMTAQKNEYLLSLLSPSLGNLPVTDILPTDVLTALQKIEAKGNLESARRAMQLASGIFRYAIATQRLKSDPTRDLRGALTAPRSKHRAAILDAGKLGELLRAIDGYQGHAHTRIALALAPHLFVRPGELRNACWEEIDFDEAVWTIPAGKTKMRKPHFVPLSRQALDLFRQSLALTSRTSGYVFPSVRTSARPISENTLNAALRRLGFTKDEATTHGFRATASTLLNQARDPRTKRPLWTADAIERALAHGDSDKVRAAYHRGEHWPERVEMADWWSDYLDGLRDGADILKFPGKARG
ncbi:tyrosine-type recombinase/integrase [Novosphingobium sp.]|uniref:tyrosine-type recombinase/integrase n=1 Tax=Novosphingobium sp. TaxID=1874826 RepID=UPI0035B1CB49